jgi:hypothetical protein
MLTVKTSFSCFPYSLITLSSGVEFTTFGHVQSTNGIVMAISLAMTMERELKGWSFELKREEGDGVK